MTLIPLGEAKGRSGWTVRARDGREFAVFQAAGRIYVTDNRCPHNGGPLADGWIRDECVLVCPWHRFRFDLRSGQCATLPRYQLRLYPVIEQNGTLVADVGDPPPPKSLAERLRAYARSQR